MNEQLGFDGFAPESPARGQQPWRIRAMYYGVYGYMPEEQCRTCKHLICKERTVRYYKCELSAVSAGAATDWRVGWDACGKWEKREEEDGGE